MMFNKIQRNNEAQKLPLGHVERFKARESLNEEYQRCHKLQRFWIKKIGKKAIIFETEKQALKFCNKICKELNNSPINKVVFSSDSLKPGTAGHYSNKEIHMGYPGFGTLIHELSHHFSRKVPIHGKDFCVCMDILFQIAYRECVGKEPKPYWIEQSQKMIEEMFLE